MKRFIFLFLLHIPFLGLIATELNEHVLPCEQERYYQEGLLPGTLIKTPDGYCPIEVLKFKDKILSNTEDGEYTEKEIIAIARRLIPFYLKISCDNTTICVASGQKFYLPKDGHWATAHSLVPGQTLLRNLAAYIIVHHIEKINEPIYVHTLTVDGHTFYATQEDLYLHNMDVVRDGAFFLIQIGCLILDHPIIKTIGGAITLAQLYLETKKELGQILPPQFSERSYYEKRRHDLKQIKNDLVAVHNGLKKISALWGDNLAAFTYEFLNAFDAETIHNMCFKVSQDQEAHYNEQQREQLRLQRQAELDYLEQQIIDLQITLGFHFNKLIEHREEAFRAVSNAMKEIQSLHGEWEKLVNNNALTTTIALIHNEKQETAQELINELEYVNRELKAVILYYNNLPDASIIKITSTITKVIAEEEIYIAVTEVFVRDQNVLLANCAYATQWFLTHISMISSSSASNAKQKRKERRAQALAQAQQQRSSMQAPQQPKKNNNENDGKKHPHGIYEEASYHHCNSTGKKSPAPKNGQAALDNSVPCPKNKNETSTSHRRIGVSEGEIVVLNRTTTGKYHGHVRTWEDLEDFMKRALDAAGLVKNGKIVCI